MATMMSSAIEMHADSVFQVIDKILSSDKPQSKDNYELQCAQTPVEDALRCEASSGTEDDLASWRVAATEDLTHPASFMVLEQPVRSEPPARCPSPRYEDDYVLTSLDDPDISQRFFAAIDNILQDYGGGGDAHQPTCNSVSQGLHQDSRVKDEYPEEARTVYFHAGCQQVKPSWHHCGSRLDGRKPSGVSFATHPMP